MKFNKVIKEDYSKLIGQIDSLKTNIAQLITVNQDTSRTVKIADNTKNKSVTPNRSKNIRTYDKKDKNSKKKKIDTQSNKQNKKTQTNESHLSQKLWQKLVQVQRSNQQIKNSHLVLQQMLRVQRQKRIKLQKQLKTVTKQKTEMGVQKDFQPNISQSFRIFTPKKRVKQDCQTRKPSKTREEGDMQSFLLGDCDEYAYSSPKKRNIGQMQIIQLMQQVSKPAPFDRRQQVKVRLLDAVKRFIRK